MRVSQDEISRAKKKRVYVMRRWGRSSVSGSIRVALSERNENVIDEMGTGERCRTMEEVRTVVVFVEDRVVLVTVREEVVVEGTVVAILVLLVDRVVVDADDDGIFAVRELFGVEHMRTATGEAGLSLMKSSNDC